MNDRSDKQLEQRIGEEKRKMTEGAEPLSMSGKAADRGGLATMPGNATYKAEPAAAAGSEEDSELAGTVQALRNGLDLLSRLEPPYTPPLAALQAQLEDVRRKRRARLLRELGALWGSGVLLLSGLYQLVHHAPAAFLALQAAAAAAPLALLLRRKKGANSYEA